MIVERFSQSVIGSGLLRLYVAIGFFATLIFFIINADHFSPMEMLIGIIVITIGLKGVAYLMLSLVIMFFNLDNKKSELDFYSKASEIEQMLADLVIKETATEAQKTNTPKGAKR
jgi:Zn-dependent membrane protease YugP